MNDVASAIAFMRINYPAPPERRYSIAIAPRPTGSTELVSDQLPVFHGATSSNFITGWIPTLRNLSACFSGLNDRQAHGQYFHPPAVMPFWMGERTKEIAINYAKGRAKFGRCPGSSYRKTLLQFAKEQRGAGT